MFLRASEKCVYHGLQRLGFSGHYVPCWARYSRYVATGIRPLFNWTYVFLVLALFRQAPNFRINPGRTHTTSVKGGEVNNSLSSGHSPGFAWRRNTRLLSCRAKYSSSESRPAEGGESVNCVIAWGVTVFIIETRVPLNTRHIGRDRQQLYRLQPEPSALPQKGLAIPGSAGIE